MEIMNLIPWSRPCMTLKNKVAKEYGDRFSFVCEPKIGGIKYRPDLMIKDNAGNAIIIEVKKGGTVCSDDIAKMAAGAIDYSAQGRAKACVLAAGDVTEDASIIARDIGVSIMRSDEQFVRELPDLFNNINLDYDSPLTSR